MADSQIKSRERVRAHGEVFTAEREVKAMCDLVKEETERIDSRFLEPACGDGNFLAEILHRKLAVCDKRYGGAVADWEKYSFLAVTSLYGIDILADNVVACRERLFGIWRECYLVSAHQRTDFGSGANFSRARTPQRRGIHRGRTFYAASSCTSTRSNDVRPSGASMK